MTSFQVSNTPDGYVVEAQVDGTWLPLRNFGWYQTDAKDYCYKDCPSLDTAKIKHLAKIYNKDVKFIRIHARLFLKQRQEDQK